MSPLPLATRALLAWLGMVTLAPALVCGAEAAGLHAPGMRPLAMLGALSGALLGLLIFEPPRKLSLKDWMSQLRERLVRGAPSITSSPQSPRQEP